MPTADAPQVRRAANRFRTETDWLSSAHSFSFGPHYDPDDVGHGRLMVSNHEILLLGAGFDDHPHADAEIVTWMLSGSLVHTDSAGRTGLVHRGVAQRTSAGSGIVHAEINDGYRIDLTLPPMPAEYVQMWVRPDASGGQPSYQQAGYDEADLAADWVAIASGREADALVRIGAQATLWVTRLAAGTSRTLPTGADVHLYLARGSVELEGAGVLRAGDAVRFHRPDPVMITAVTDPAHAAAEVLVWQMDR